MSTLTNTQLATLDSLSSSKDTDLSVGYYELEGWKPFRAIGRAFKAAWNWFKGPFLETFLDIANEILNSPIVGGIVTGISVITAPIGGAGLAAGYAGLAAGVKLADELYDAGKEAVELADEAAKGLKEVAKTANKRGAKIKIVADADFQADMKNRSELLQTLKENAETGEKRGKFKRKVIRAYAEKELAAARLFAELVRIQKEHPQSKRGNLNRLVKDKTIDAEDKALILLLAQTGIQAMKPAPRRMIAYLQEKETGREVIDRSEIRKFNRANGVPDANQDPKAYASWVQKQIRALGLWLSGEGTLTRVQKRWLKLFGVEAPNRIGDKPKQQKDPKKEKRKAEKSRARDAGKVVKKEAKTRAQRALKNNDEKRIGFGVMLGSQGKKKGRGKWQRLGRGFAKVVLSDGTIDLGKWEKIER